MNETILHFEAGIYEGVSQHLSEACVSIGSSLDDDVSLCGSTLHPRHVSLRSDPRRRRVHVVEAHHAGVVVGGRPLAAGTGIAVRLPTTLAIADDVALRWERAAPPRPAGGRIAKGIGFAMLGLVLLAASFNTLPSLAFLGATDGAIKPAEPVDALPVPDASHMQAAAPEPPLQDDAAAELHADLSARGLSDIVLTAAPGSITARGRLTPEQYAAWREAQHAFDARVGDRTSLVNLVSMETKPSTTLPQISAVWRGADPYIVVRGGKYRVGSLIGAEWTVVAISADLVTLQDSAGEQTLVRF